jgi:hypothetical protein
MENIVREKQFNTRYQITEKAKPYNSLEDPHTSFYFCSSPARKQLKFLKKTVKDEPN